MKFGTSQDGGRVEDRRFLTGRGRFLANRLNGNTHHMVLVRSPEAHADIRAIDVDRAREMPGVIGVLTASDLAAEGIGTIPCGEVLPSIGDRETFVPPFHLLADGRVRFIGQAVAAVIANTLTAAQDAAEAVEIDYAVRMAVSDVETAIKGSVVLWPEAPDNISMHWQTGDGEAVAAAFSRADHVVTVDLVNNRISANPMETRGAIAEYDPSEDAYVLYTNSQGQHETRNVMADEILGIPRGKLRVVCSDVGGGFGMKGFPYPEQALALVAARRFGQPVAWVCDRTDALASDYHARDHVTVASLALDDAGRFLAMKIETLANVGAVLSSFGLFIPTDCYVHGVPGAYDIPAIHVDVRGVFTNTSPVDAYRGAGRAEGTYVLERLVDQAARAIGLDPLELRRRNLLGSDVLPYTTALGETYDCGAFQACLEAAVERADVTGAPERKALSSASGRLRGVGIGCALTPVGYTEGDTARIRVESTGAVAVSIGNVSCGQGHETTAVRMVSRALGIDPGLVRVVQGDTERTTELVDANGGSTFLQSAGPALAGAADAVIAKGRLIAAHLLEASASDVSFDAGSFHVVGTDRKVGFSEIANAAYDPANLPGEIRPGLDEAHFHAAQDTYPFGCHIAEVEVVPATGEVGIVAYSVVSDFGNILNPGLVTGQVHGGMAQGIGQALSEHMVYGRQGELLAGSFMDYAMPRASHCPAPDMAFIEDPAPTNALGVKGCGEVPTCSAAPAVINAVLDALAPLGVTELQMPATPARVWEAIRRAG